MVFQQIHNGTDPVGAQQTYNYLKGLLPDGSVLVNPVTGSPTRFAVSGDPVAGLGWLDTNPSDRRMTLSSGPFTMAPGDSQEIVAAIVIGQGADPLSSVSKMECFDDYVQAVFQSGLSRPFPAPDTSACPVATNCPRPASFWAGECKAPTHLTPQQLDQIATWINDRSIFFDWRPGPSALSSALRSRPRRREPSGSGRSGSSQRSWPLSAPATSASRRQEGPRSVSSRTRR